MDFLSKYLNETISITSLTDDLLLNMEMFTGPDGNICNIKYDKQPTLDAKNHIEKVLKDMTVFKNYCFILKRTIILNEFIKAGEILHKVVPLMPLFNGCQRTDDKVRDKNCSNRELKNYLNNHPLYHQLQGNLQRTTYILDFVITPEGKCTLITTKKGNFEGKEDIFKQIIEEIGYTGSY